jgi:hypothetical protein
LVTGAWIGMNRGGSGWSLLLFVMASLALFCLRTPVESLLGTTPMRAQTPAERCAVSTVIAVFAAIAAVSLVALLWAGHNRGLLVLGAAAAALFVGQALVKKLGRRGRMPSQVVGALGLTCTAPGAYYVVTGRFDAVALALWFANWLFAGNQIHFVQLRIHGARLNSFAEKFSQGSSFFLGQIVMLVTLAAAWRLGLLPAFVLVAFAPVLLRGVRWFFGAPEPLAVHRLGYIELAHAITFGVLLIVSFSI